MTPAEKALTAMSMSDVIDSGQHGVSTDDEIEQSNGATLHRLSMYIGPNWRQHYEPVFTRLLAENRIGGRRRWTWNWAAALTPFWFLYRRLYGPFFLSLVAYKVIRAMDAAWYTNGEGGWHWYSSDLLLLHVVQLVVQGRAADTLLYKKATIQIQAQPPLSDAELARRGKPNKAALLSIVGLFAALFLVGFLVG